MTLFEDSKDKKKDAVALTENGASPSTRERPTRSWRTCSERPPMPSRS